MTVLTRDAIRAELDAGRLVITPFEQDQLGAASIDLTLGDEIRVIDHPDQPIDLLAHSDYRDHTRVASLTTPYVLALERESTLVWTFTLSNSEMRVCGISSVNLRSSSGVGLTVSDAALTCILVKHSLSFVGINRS